MTHAITRILSFLIIAFFLALGEGSVIVFCCLIAGIIYLLDPPEDIQSVFRSVVKMKWLFISILLVYLFLNNSNVNFTTQLYEGLKRILILIIMMLLVTWLIKKTPRDQIISALIFLLSPLRFLGLSVHTLALRIELVFRNIDDVRSIITQEKDKTFGNIKSINEIGETVSGIYSNLIHVIEEKPLHELAVEVQSPASVKQWLAPLILFVVLFLIHLSS